MLSNIVVLINSPLPSLPSLIFSIPSLPFPSLSLSILFPFILQRPMTKRQKYASMDRIFELKETLRDRKILKISSSPSHLCLSWFDQNILPR